MYKADSWKPAWYNQNTVERAIKSSNTTYNKRTVFTHLKETIRIRINPGNVSSNFCKAASRSRTIVRSWMFRPADAISAEYVTLVIFIVALYKAENRENNP